MRNSRAVLLFLLLGLFLSLLPPGRYLPRLDVVQGSNIVQPSNSPTGIAFLNTVTQQNRLTSCVHNAVVTLACVGDSVAGVGTFADGGTDDAPIPLGQHITATTGSVIGNDAGYVGEPNVYRAFLNPVYRAKVRIIDTGTVRIFMGLADATVAQMAGADAPAFVYVGFQYSTPRADANWQCISSDTGTVQQITNSGVAIAAGEVVLDVRVTAGISVEFFLNGAAVCTHTTRVPAAADALSINQAIETQAGASRSIGTGWITILTNR